MTVLADSIYAVPSEIGDARPATAAALAKLVHIDPTDSFTAAPQILARFNASRNFAWVARKQDPAVIAKVKALNLKGVYVQKEFKRFYPDNQMASEVLGYVGLDDNGLGWSSTLSRQASARHAGTHVDCIRRAQACARQRRARASSR